MLTYARPSLRSVALGLALVGCGADSDGEPVGGEGGESGGGASTSTQAGETETEGGSTEDGADGSSDEGSESGGSAVDYADVYALETTFPEGGAFDPVEELFYVGTLEGGAVHEIDPRSGAQSVLFTEPEKGDWMTLGMAVDATGRKLWVCAADRQTDPFTGQLWVIDLATGERDRVVPLVSEGEAAWCEDVAVAADGTAYATDRENPNIYRVGAGDDAELFATDAALGSAQIGQNGIVVLPDDGGIIAAVHLPARLNHISTAGVVTPVEIEGDFLDMGIGAGADGMIYADDGLVVVFDGKLARVMPSSADWSAAVSTTVELPRGLTDVVNTPVGLYLVNGQAIRFALGQGAKGPFELVRFTGDL